MNGGRREGYEDLDCFLNNKVHLNNDVVVTGRLGNDSVPIHGSVLGDYSYSYRAPQSHSDSLGFGLSGIGIGSLDEFGHSLSRGILSGAAGYVAGRLSQSVGLGDFASSVIGSLASAYAGAQLATEGDSGLSSLGHISESHGERSLEIEVIGFNPEQFRNEIDQIKQTIFDNAISDGATPEEAEEIAEQEKQKFVQDLNAGKTEVEETSDFVGLTGKNTVDEIKAEIGEAEAAKLANKQPVSKETREIVAKHFKSAAHKLRVKKNKLNFEAPLHEDPVAQASRETQNQLIDEQLLVYENVLSFLSMEQPRLRRSNSSDNLLQDTYIRQGMRFVGEVIAPVTEVASEVLRPHEVPADI